VWATFSVRLAAPGWGGSGVEPAGLGWPPHVAGHAAVRVRASSLGTQCFFNPDWFCRVGLDTMPLAVDRTLFSVRGSVATQCADQDRAHGVRWSRSDATASCQVRAWPRPVADLVCYGLDCAVNSLALRHGSLQRTRIDRLADSTVLAHQYNLVGVSAHSVGRCRTNRNLDVGLHHRRAATASHHPGFVLHTCGV
jgi:hypothetical protein